MEEKDKQSGEQQHRSRTKPPATPRGTIVLSLQDQEAAAPASSHSTKRKTPAVGGEAQEAAASSRPRTKSTTPAVGREARRSKRKATICAGAMLSIMHGGVCASGQRRNETI